MTVEFYNIKYDTQGEEIALPTRFTFPIPERVRRAGQEQNFIGLNGYDMIHDKAGWPVESFAYRIIP